MNKNKEEINLDELSADGDNARAAKELKQAMTNDKTVFNDTPIDNVPSAATNTVVTVMDPLPLEPSSSSEESSAYDNEEAIDSEDDTMPFEEAIKVEGLGLVKYYKGFCVDTCQHKLDFQNLSYKPWEVP